MIKSVKYTLLSIIVNLVLLYLFFPLDNILPTLRDSSEDLSSIRIVCLVLTQLKNHNTRAQIIKSSWGKKCTRLIFITNSTEHLSEENVLNLHHADSYNTIWNKTKQGFKYAYEKYKDEAEWFMKTDDDSFLVMENLQKMLIERNANPNDPIWFGHHYRVYIKQGYMAGAAYILSRESTRRFVEKALKFKDPNLCQVTNNQGYEDLEMGRCLNSVGVVPGDSRDEYLRARMYCVNAEMALNPWLPDKQFWFWKYNKHPQYFGHPGCCSDRPINFHYVAYDKLHLYNYLIYNAFVHGENNKYRTPPDPKTLVQNMNINWTYILE